MARLKLSDGKVFVKNTTDDAWYGVGIDYVVDAEGNLQPTLSLDQVATAIVSEDSYESFVTLKASDGTFKKIKLITITGVITYTLIDEIAPAVSLFLKDTNDVTYQVILTENNGDYFLEVVAGGSNAALVGLPWRTIVPVDFQVNTSVIVPVNS